MTGVDPVHIRHVRLGLSSEPGAVEVNGAWYVPEDRLGLNAGDHWQSGEVELRLFEEGRLRLTIPNGTGGDGKLHRDRLLSLRSNYHTGDEWFEVYEGEALDGDPTIVATPESAKVNEGMIELECFDALYTLKKVRETAAVFWQHGLRDVFEHYTRAWRAVVSDDFVDPGFTYLDAEQTSPDGKWLYTRGENSPNDSMIRLRASGTGAAGELQSVATFKPFVNITDTARECLAPLRFEARLYPTTGNITEVYVADAPETLGPIVGVIVSNSTTQVVARDSDGTDLRQGGVLHANRPKGEGYGHGGSSFVVAIEIRERWVYFYVNGGLIGITPKPNGNEAARAMVKTWASAGGTQSVDVDYALVRQGQRWLMRGPEVGDIVAPGVLTSGGLWGTYYDASSLKIGDFAQNHRYAFAPHLEPYAARVDKAINFASASGDPPSWLPAGPAGGDNVLVRWTGSIYLDFDAVPDYRFRVTDLDDRARLWIASTRWGETLLDDFQQAGSASHTLGPSSGVKGLISAAAAAYSFTMPDMPSGWYPIVLEFWQQAGNAGCVLQYEETDNPGVWTTVTTEMLSPYGFYTEQPRHESHYEMLSAVLNAGGHQYTIEPKSLESGLFPGVLVPRLRVGRDTDYVLREDESHERSVELNAADVVDTLIADAAGIADPDSSTQLSAEMLAFEGMEGRAFVQSEYESLSEISETAMLQQRLTSLVSLRSSPWEAVNARPTDSRKSLADSFPITGDLLEFDWSPGDGIRLELPRLGVKDQSPRQILGVTKTITPNSVGSPTVSFRQRPRGTIRALRSILREARNAQRNYQGQLAVVQSAPRADSTTSAASFLVLPANVGKVARVEVVIDDVVAPGGATFDIFINGIATGININGLGRRDVTAFCARDGTRPRIYLSLNRVGGVGTDAAWGFLEMIRQV